MDENNNNKMMKMKMEMLSTHLKQIKETESKLMAQNVICKLIQLYGKGKKWYHNAIWRLPSHHFQIEAMLIECVKVKVDWK